MKNILKRLLIAMLFLSGIINCHASTNTFNREELENYGVRKEWKITDNNIQNVLKTPAVDSSEKIYDYANLLTEDEENNLKERINEFIEKSKMDIAIVTTDFSYSSDSENENYAADFYDYNDFGMDFENTSGVLFLRNANSEDPYYDMYTFGNAQLYFDQARYDNILDGIYDLIHSGQYLEGFKNFVGETERYISMGKPKEMDNYYVDKEGYLQKYPETYHIPWGIALISSSVITLVAMLILIKKNRMVKKATQATQYLQKESINITNRKDIFITSHTTSYTESSSSGSGGGFSSHGGSSGGGHSSGGGRHG